MKRIYSLDLLKLVFSYIIAFFHFGTTIAPGPTVTVQVFFIVSGFFLGKKFYSRSHGNDGYDQWDYTLDHVRSLYPMYLVSVALFFGYTLARSLVYLVLEPSLEGLGQIFLSFYHQIPDLLLLQSAYHYHDSLNYPLWQLSALLIAGYFVYGALCWDEKRSRKLLFPAAILMIQSLLYTGVDIWGNWGPFYIPLLRAFSPLCAGVLAWYFTTTAHYAVLKKHPVAFNLAVLYALVSLFAYADDSNVFLVTVPMLLWGCWDEGSWINKLLNRKAFRRCGDLSLAVYCNHALIARFLEARVFMPLESRGTPAPLWQQNAIYFILLTACSLAVLFMVDLWKKRRKKVLSTAG